MTWPMMLILLAIIGLAALLLSGFRKSPILKAEDISPTDMKVTTTVAERIYREYMQNNRIYDGKELTQRAIEFSNGISSRLNRYEVVATKISGDIARCESDLVRLRSDLENAIASETESIKQQINESSEFLASAKSELSSIERDRRAFKEDKKAYLIDYINTELQGTQWRKK